MKIRTATLQDLAAVTALEEACFPAADARQQGRRGLVLTCKDRLVPYYAKFGFADEGMSDSNHGGVAWHQMRVRF